MKLHTHSWLGIGFFTLLFFGSFMIGEGRYLMFNLTGLLVVVAGTLGAAFMSYPMMELSTAVKVVVNSYRTPPPTKKEIVDALLDLSLKSRVDGLLALEEEEERVSVLFLRRALTMLVDGFRIEELRDALYTEIYFFQQRRSQHERVFRHLAMLAPAFGVAGSVIGLIGMLAGIGNTGVILQTIPIALTSTLYGIVLAYFLLIPLAENIRAKTQEELLVLKLITEGVTLIAQEYNTVRLQTRLESFLAPQVRNTHHKSFMEIHNRYEEIRKERVAGAESVNKAPKPVQQAAV